MIGRYDDIIHLPHHVSSTRPQMSMMDRAAQFSPFKALTGYDANIKETGRYTSERIELAEDAIYFLTVKMGILVDQLPKGPVIRITYFEPDEKKSGGSYRTVSGKVKKVDSFDRALILQNGEKIPMDDILDLEGDIFGSLD